MTMHKASKRSGTKGPGAKPAARGSTNGVSAKKKTVKATGARSARATPDAAKGERGARPTASARSENKDTSDPKRGSTSPAPASASKSDSSKGPYGVRPSSKLAIIIASLQETGGHSIAELAQRTGWQKHSVHGVISGTLRTKMGLEITTEKRDGVHYYHLMG